MALLKVISGDLAGSVYTVGSDALNVGRAEGNDLCIGDGSISSRHCEMSLDTSGNLLVRDLNSTNGTFIEGQRVNQALVQPGQRLRLGNLEMLFEADGAAQTAPETEAAPVALNLPPPPLAPARVVGTTATAIPVVVATPAVAGPNDCSNHPGTLAKWVCQKCGRKACADCTRQQKLGMTIVNFCQSCGGQCKKAEVAAREAATIAAIPKSFATAVKGSLSYPFRGNGLILLICGTLFYAFMDVLTSFAFLYAIPLVIITYGYLFAYMQKIVVCSAAGDNEPPGWPEVSDLTADIVQPFFQLLATLAVAFVPSWIVWIKMGPLAGQFTLLLGMVYFPMALLGVAMSDSYGALNPLFVLSSIMRAPKNYVVACLAFGLVLFLRIYAHKAVGAMATSLSGLVFFLFAYWFVLLIGLMVQMRILGVFYFMNRRVLGWGV